MRYTQTGATTATGKWCRRRSLLWQCPSAEHPARHARTSGLFAVIGGMDADFGAQRPHSEEKRSWWCPPPAAYRPGQQNATALTSFRDAPQRRQAPSLLCVHTNIARHLRRTCPQVQAAITRDHKQQVGQLEAREKKRSTRSRGMLPRIEHRRKALRSAAEIARAQRRLSLASQSRGPAAELHYRRAVFSVPIAKQRPQRSRREIPQQRLHPWTIFCTCSQSAGRRSQRGR